MLHHVNTGLIYEPVELTEISQRGAEAAAGAQIERCVSFLFSSLSLTRRKGRISAQALSLLGLMLLSGPQVRHIATFFQVLIY